MTVPKGSAMDKAAEHNLCLPFMAYLRTVIPNHY
jgi:hypothetical protein